jgi:hypothetical protein
MVYLSHGVCVMGVDLEEEVKETGTSFYTSSVHLTNTMQHSSY